MLLSLVFPMVNIENKKATPVTESSFSIYVLDNYFFFRNSSTSSGTITASTNV